MNNRLDNQYNVKNYTDSELYDMLDLVNPSDRILEAKIVQMINRYASIPGESGEKLARFFKEIYDRFFYDEEEDIKENFENTENLDLLEEGFETQDGKKTTNDISQNIVIDVASSSVVNNGKLTNTDNTQKSASISVNPVNYAKDRLNPLLKQTVKRIISIDSQYRDNKNSLSTNFTFNLSEPLKDVVALRLYSIQIPYTWYTISKNFGGNFFYLKGNSPGIDAGDFDYLIDISSGNYSPQSLADAVNSTFSLIKQNNTDVSFGNSGINYNSSTSLATFNIDIKNNYDETNYSLQFQTDTTLNNYPIATDSTGKQLRYSNDSLSTLSSYLGFNKSTYTPNSIVSVNNINYKLPKISNTSLIDSGSPIYTVNGSNNFFTIYQYIGPSSFVDVSTTINFSTTITLDLSGLYTRNQIVNELNSKLSLNPYLTNSYITRTDVSGANLQDNGLSYFSLFINWNKKTTPNSNINSMKSVVVFPNETNKSSRIWTLDPSGNVQNICFYFLNTISEVNNIISESDVKQTNYNINSNPYLLLKCITPGYTVDYNNNMIDGSGALTSTGFGTFSTATIGNKTYRIKNKNDYLITVPNSVTSYSLNDYLSAINFAIATSNTYSVDTTNINGVFNLQNMQVYDNASTNNKVLFRFDINKHFKNNSYLIDLSGSYLFNTLNVGKTAIGINSVNGMSIDLSSNNIFSGKITQGFSSYTNSFVSPTPDNPKPPENYIAKIYPNTNRNFDNKTAEPFYIYPLDYLSHNMVDFSQMITASFQTFQDPLDNSYPFTNSQFEMTTDPITLEVTSTLTIIVDKYLTQNNYRALFYDPSANGQPWNNKYNTWFTNLKISDPSYSLINYNVDNQPYSDIYGSDILSGYTFTMQQPTTIKLKGINNGVLTTTGANDFIITIPAAPFSSGFKYTLQQIYDIINNEFDSNPETAGSTISTLVVGTTNYVNIRLNINKTYTAKDYRLVFYDPFSFVKCVSGVSAIKNVTWDSTLGWILGYREQTEYILSDLYSGTGTSISITGDTTVSTNLYNYFLIVLNDYTQSHLNDGLITLTPQENNISLPSYSSKSTFQCDSSGNSTFTGALSNLPGNSLTQNQIYSANQINSGNRNKTKTYSSGPFIQDIFGLIPMKVAGLSNGSAYIEFGGTLQNQERTYFGPVNLKRMTIQLITDRGDSVDLNGQNWSFSFICEQLYQQNSI